jgi:hypothetical protein
MAALTARQLTFLLQIEFGMGVDTVAGAKSKVVHD